MRAIRCGPSGHKCEAPPRRGWRQTAHPSVREAARERAAIALERASGLAVVRNGYRERDWETRATTVELRIPVDPRPITSRCQPSAVRLSSNEDEVGSCKLVVRDPPLVEVTVGGVVPA